jgi:hypothetical protein
MSFASSKACFASFGQVPDLAGHPLLHDKMRRFKEQPAYQGRCALFLRYHPS